MDASSVSSREASFVVEKGAAEMLADVNVLQLLCDGEFRVTPEVVADELSRRATLTKGRKT